MCRYALVDYKQTYACFACRKVFKKVTLTDYLRQHGLSKKFDKLTNCRKKSEQIELEQKYGTTADNIINEYQQKICKCPDCGGEMANMGMDFKAPKIQDIKEWKIIEGMYQIGAIYQTCGCHGFGYVPKNINDYVEYLNNHLSAYRSRLDDVINDESLTSFQRKEQSRYWSKRIESVSEELDRWVNK